MNQTEEKLLGVVIDICTRSFLLISDKGNTKTVTADNPEEFMAILAVCDNQLEESQIEYADLAIS